MRRRWPALIVVILMWVATLAVFRALPAEVPTHWNLRGEVDDWMPRWPGAFVAPLIATLIVGLMLALPRIDPRRVNVAHSTSDRVLMTNLVVLFFALLHVTATASALGYPVDESGWMMGGLGLLFVGMGNYLPRIRSNWWLGIRTPWTLDSDRVWRETHRLGGRLFVAGGLAMIAAVLLPAEPRAWVIGAVIGTIAVVPLVYSFLVWRRETAGRS
jgi:uncharacterized membrane protein